MARSLTLNINIKNTRVGRKITSINLFLGARGSVVVKALYYKPEGHGFETQ
jgi:hypothetical protein